MADFATVHQLTDVQDGIIRAVQEELTSFGQQVATELGRVREELASEQAARRQLDEQIRALASAVERALGTGRGAELAELKRSVDELAATSKRRHEDLDRRVTKVVDEVHNGLATAVEAAAGPIVQDLEHRQSGLESEIGTLATSLRRFDEQAARMVTHFNALTNELEGRMEEIPARMSADVDERLAGIVVRVDELAAGAARQQTETAQIVGQRVDQAEDRINERLIGTEARVREELGSQIADIDAHVGRVSAGLDDSVSLLADRIAATDAKFEQVDERFEGVAELVRNVDVEAIDEMKEKVASAAGEAMLVRIEMERFQKTVNETQDRTNVRLTEVETAMQEQHLDVETAIQLERLEEVERALLALDPARFVKVTDLESALVAASGSKPAPPAPTGRAADMPAPSPLAAPAPHRVG